MRRTFEFGTYSVVGHLKEKARNKKRGYVSTNEDWKRGGGGKRSPPVSTSFFPSTHHVSERRELVVDRQARPNKKSDNLRSQGSLERPFPEWLCEIEEEKVSSTRLERTIPLFAKGRLTWKINSLTPNAYFCHLLISSSAVRLWATQKRKTSASQKRVDANKERGRDSRHSFLESSESVGTPSNDVAFPQKSKSHVEVLTDVRFRPEESRESGSAKEFEHGSFSLVFFSTKSSRTEGKV